MKKSGDPFKYSATCLLCDRDLQDWLDLRSQPLSRWLMLLKSLKFSENIYNTKGFLLSQKEEEQEVLLTAGEQKRRRGTDLPPALLSFGLSSSSAPGRAAGGCGGAGRCSGYAGIRHPLQPLPLHTQRRAVIKARRQPSKSCGRQ